MNYTQKIYQILTDLEYVLTLIRAGIPAEDVSSRKGYIVGYFHDVDFWAFRLPEADKQAAHELLQEVQHEFVTSWSNTLTTPERAYYSR